MKSVRLTNCSNAFNAQLIKGKLESEGIPCALSNEIMSGYNIMSGVDVFVDEEDLDRAQLVISEDLD